MKLEVLMYNLISIHLLIAAICLATKVILYKTVLNNLGTELSNTYSLTYILKATILSLTPIYNIYLVFKTLFEVVALRVIKD